MTQTSGRHVMASRLFFASMLLTAGSTVSTAAMAQETASRMRVWGAIGAGASIPASGGEGITNMAQIVFQKAPHHVAIRGLILHDIDRSTNEIGELGALYGRVRFFPWGNASVAAGISGVGFSACPDDDDSCFTFGIPILAEAARSGKFFGLGIQAFGNLNSKAAYAGAILFVQVGRLK